MKTPKTRLLVAALAVSFPVLALAQVVVPPPVPLGVAPQAPQANTAPKVSPPLAVNSVNPAAAAPVTAPPAQTLIDIALPDAPKPEKELRPVAPAAVAATKTPAKKSVSKRDDAATESAKPAKPLDPYAGLAVTPVSDSQLNRFVFPEAVEGIFFPEGAPLPECPKDAGPMDPCKPVFLNGKKVMLLQMRAGAKGPVQMMTHLASGRFVTLNLAPAAGPGAVIRVDGAEDGASDSRLAAKTATATSDRGGMSSSEQHVALLSRFAAGDIPEGFEPVAAGTSIRFEHFDVVPMVTWENGANLRAHLFQVKAHTDAPVLINAGLFRNANVRALALDRETITKSAPAQLYMLEFVPSEAQ